MRQNLVNHALSVTDQVVVSLARFATAVIIGRWSDTGELGIYALGVSLLAFVLVIQDSLVSLPYTIRRHDALVPPAQFAGSSVIQSLMLSALGAAVLICIALGLSSNQAYGAFSLTAWILAVIVPFALLREFARRFTFAHLEVWQALVIDIIVSGVQLSLLLGLARTDRLSAAAALVVLGLSCAIAGVGWLFLVRRRFALALHLVAPTAKRNWQLGKWLVAWKATSVVQQYVTYWILALVGGTATTGVYAACMSVASFANPLVAGLGNVLMPNLVSAWRANGSAGVKAQAIRFAVVLVGAIGPFSAALFIVGDDVLRLLFGGEKFERHGHTVAVLVAATLVTAVGMPASSAQASIEQPQPMVVVTILGAALTALLVWVMLLQWGILGAAYGFLGGSLAGTLGRWYAFLAYLPRDRDQTHVSRMLRDLTRTPGRNDCAIERLGEGDDAVVYRARADLPIVGIDTDVAVKLYKLQPDFDTAEARRQAEALRLLNAEVDRTASNGWTLSVPKVCHLSESPLAIVMSVVRGNNLKIGLLIDPALGPTVLGVMGQTLCETIGRMWAKDHVHGDLSPQNIIYEIETRTLGLIDPGGPKSCAECNDGTSSHNAAVRDLGHCLWALEIEMKLPRRRAVVMRKRAFAKGLLCGYLAASYGRNVHAVLAEVESCARAHFLSTFASSLSPRGVWHRLFAWIAMRRIRAVLRAAAAAHNHMRVRSH